MLMSDSAIGLPRADSEGFIVERRKSPPGAHDQVAALMPRRPATVEATGLEPLFIADLLAKTLFLRGKLSLAELSAHVRLSRGVLDAVLVFLRNERLIEVARRGSNEGDVEYQLTEEGRRRAIEKLERCQYAGPAPVTLADYTRVVEQYSISRGHVSRDEVEHAFADVIVPDGMLDRFGPAMNSGRAMFVYGPAGSGKTYLAERLCRLLGGAVPVPHAVLVDGEVIQVLDPLVHKPVPIPERPGGLIDRREMVDQRWVLCERPVVLTGGELSLPMLDLHFDESSRFYQAPPHFKANNGIFIVDDLGRQLVAPRDLMNRWIVPLDRRCDYLALHTGYKFRVPFDVVVVFSTNLNPSDLADEAFLRRLGYKIRIGSLSVDDYRKIFEKYCTEQKITFKEEVFDYLVRELHGHFNRPLLACYPRDLLGQVRDLAIYNNEPPELTKTAIRHAWETYFVTE